MFSNELVKVLKFRDYQKEAFSVIENSFGKKREEFNDPFANIKGCNIDLATGTGKTHLIIATAILAIEKGVKNVVIFSPSLIIKQGIKEKFNDFLVDDNLKNLLAANAISFKLCDANDSVTNDNQIFISNVHTTYENSVSSFTYEKEDFANQKTLVIFDEFHHSLNNDDIGMKVNEWIKNINPEYLFGFTGTPYKNNESMGNIGYSYKIFDALEEGYVKKVKYVSEDSSTAYKHIWDKVKINHEDIKKKVVPLKPITLVVVDKISTLDQVLDQMMKANIPFEKILLISSASKHKENLGYLNNIDSPKNNFEYILSVSKLTEGWDAKNVFQIVPYEERAFNSKLLISQVLGRGLRIAFPVMDQRNELTVYNHSSWSKTIEPIIMGMIEGDAKIVVRSNGVDLEIPFQIVEKHSNLQIIQNKKIEVPTKFDFLPQEKVIVNTTHFKTSSNENSSKEYEIKEHLIKVEDVVRLIHNVLRNRNVNVSFESLHSNLIQHLNGSEFISEENAFRYKQAFSLVTKKENTHRIKVESTIRYEKRKIQSRDSNIFFRSLNDRECTLIYNPQNVSEVNAEIIENVIEKNNFYSNSFYQSHKLINDAFIASKPERIFVKDMSSSKFVEWIYKFSDVNEFEIQYSEKIEGTKREYIQRSFNPDFLVKINDKILIIEVKSDDDTSYTNYRKMLAKNEFIKEVRKQGVSNLEFLIASPCDFQDIINGLTKTKLESKLEEIYG